MKHFGNLVVAFLLASSSLSAAPTAPVLEGTFRLESATRTLVETDEVEDSFGAQSRRLYHLRKRSSHDGLDR
jgi:hypothetical protein